MNSSLPRCFVVFKQTIEKPNFNLLSVLQIAAIRYNSQVYTLWNFNEATDEDSIIERINTIPYDGEGTRTGLALAYAAANSLRRSNGNRRDVSDIAFVLTDGKAQDNPETTVQVCIVRPVIKSYLMKASLYCICDALGNKTR